MLLAALWFLGGTALSNPAPGEGVPTATIDRLAKPTLPPQPSQADFGAQDFWLDCLPCHGDKGQGLTDEFRQVYPPEDRNCWTAGCHGDHPYRNGWTLPTVVPRVIGGGALNGFRDAAGLHAFISSAMPFQAPGSFDDKTYWELTAFLLRENGVLLGSEEVGPSNASQILIRPAATPLATPSVSGSQSDGTNSVFLAGIALIVFGLFVFLSLQFKKNG